MAIKISTAPSRLVIELGGEIDHHNASALRIEADEAIRMNLCQTVRLDFGGVTFMDSSGIGFVMGRYRTVESYGGRLEVVNLSPRVYSMMKLAGIEKIAVLKMKERVKK